MVSGAAFSAHVVVVVNIDRLEFARWKEKEFKQDSSVPELALIYFVYYFTIDKSWRGLQNVRRE